MNILNVPMIVALGGALIVVGCDREPKPKTGPVAVTGSPATPRPPAPVADPSLPSATSAVGEQGGASAPTARDSAANRPADAMTKQEEASAMPKANQANNHSSTALDPKTSKP